MRHPSRYVVLLPRAPALIVLAITLAAGACGGGGYSSPSVPSTPATTQPAAAALTVTINAAGVNPQKVQVPMGGSVTFVNNDTRTHQIMSDPNPLHNDCPAINDVSMLAPGQSRQTAALSVARACGYHDHMNPGSAALQGILLVGGAEDPGTHY
jgi:plastocyanin